jgi:hypothetical protein
MRLPFQFFNGGRESLRRCAPAVPRLVLLFICAILLPAWDIGPPKSFLADGQAIKRAIAQLREKLAPKTRIFSVEIWQDRVTLLAQDPLNHRLIQAWRLQKESFRGINWESVAGPEPESPVLGNPDPEANLFDLAEVNLDAVDELMKAAIKRADLDDAAHVSEIVFRRRVYIVSRASGAVEWHVHVASAWESADFYANADGTIRAAELRNTHKAQNFDLFKLPELSLDAAKAFRAQLGAGQILRKVTISKRGIYFSTNLPDDRGTGVRMVGKDFATYARYSWNPYNLCSGCVEQETSHPTYIGEIAPDRGAPFGIDDVDWTAVPKLMAAAKEKLGMPEGQVSDIVLTKPLDPVDAPKFLWKVEVTDKNRETGSIQADLSGNVRQVRLPESRAAPPNWSAPDKVMEALSLIATKYGANAKLSSVSFQDHIVTFTVEDPAHPGEFAGMQLTSGGFTRSIGPARSISDVILMDGKPFTIADLGALKASKIADLKTRTLALVKHPDWPAPDVSIERSRFSRKGILSIGMATHHPRTHDGARVVYDLDGTVVDIWKD